jgi:hypothetical protein
MEVGDTSISEVVKQAVLGVGRNQIKQEIGNTFIARVKHLYG